MTGSAMALAGCIGAAVGGAITATLLRVRVKEAEPAERNLLMNAYLYVIRDLVHQSRWGSVDSRRAELANELAIVLCRLDGAAALRQEWWVAFACDGREIAEAERRISALLQEVGHANEVSLWRSIETNRNPLDLAHLIVHVMNPERGAGAKCGGPGEHAQ